MCFICFACLLKWWRISHLFVFLIFRILFLPFSMNFTLCDWIYFVSLSLLLFLFSFSRKKKYRWDEKRRLVGEIHWNVEDMFFLLFCVYLYWGLFFIKVVLINSYWVLMNWFRFLGWLILPRVLGWLKSNQFSWLNKVL